MFKSTACKPFANGTAAIARNDATITINGAKLYKNLSERLI